MNVDVVVRDVRSFAGRQVIPVRPLTILIGENSTGKSTFLAILSALLDENAFPLRLTFNRSPYDLGNHDNIVNAIKRKTNKSTADFAIGLIRDSGGDSRPVEAIATYAGPRG